MRACIPLLLVATAHAQGTFAVEPLKPDPARDARIEELIESLRGIETVHDGGTTCWSGGGVSFDALDDDAPPAFRELVRLGPAAIPAPLDHLTDKRRTRLGFRTDDGFNIYGWVRNALDEEYFDFLTFGPSNTGLVAGQPGDPRTWGGTIRYEF